MVTKMLLLGIRGTEQDRQRLAQAAEALTKRNELEGRPGKVSASDVGVLAVRKYLKELEEAGVIPTEQ
jgi:hypothetical protein